MSVAVHKCGEGRIVDFKCFRHFRRQMETLHESVGQLGYLVIRMWFMDGDLEYTLRAKEVVDDF
jgi:hypothetical protein